MPPNLEGTLVDGALHPLTKTNVRKGQHLCASLCHNVPRIGVFGVRSLNACKPLWFWNERQGVKVWQEVCTELGHVRTAVVRVQEYINDDSPTSPFDSLVVFLQIRAQDTFCGAIVTTGWSPEASEHVQS